VLGVGGTTGLADKRSRPGVCPLVFFQISHFLERGPAVLAVMIAIFIVKQSMQLQFTEKQKCFLFL
jgi:hypothetical protein